MSLSSLKAGPSPTLFYKSQTHRPLFVEPTLSPLPMNISSISTEEEEENSRKYQHLYVLPVLLLEFLALALTRAVLPHLLLEKYQERVYLIMGFAEFVRGILAFISCPLFGKLSDIVGRRLCLLVTVAGTCAPVCSLALISWDSAMDSPSASGETDLEITASTAFEAGQEGNAMWMIPASAALQPHAISIFVVLLSLSGIFSSTFTLTFAYISDSVHDRQSRVSAFGLALATFGLSFTIGPMAGGYLARYNTRYVFVCSLVLTILDLLYIYAILPESKRSSVDELHRGSGLSLSSFGEHKVSWNPWDTMRIIAIDPFLRLVGQVAFFYYTALWAVISTLVLYAAKRFHLGPERLGELMSAFGLATMVAEAVLVRIVVPILGEKRSMRLGLVAFGLQCIVLGLAYEGWHLFVCILLSMVGNLVYPSLSSLVSSSVEPDAVGEALGAVNGIKALTEGIGPLVFGSLMTLSERSILPGWPYLVAALIVYVAYQYSGQLPDVENDEYIHELERKKRTDIFSSIDRFSRNQAQHERALRGHYFDPDDDEEISGLMDDGDHGNFISEVEESDGEEDLSRLPVTFASMMLKQTGK